MNEDAIAAGLASTPGYRYADRSDSQLFVAGQVPLDRDGVLVGPGSPAARAVQRLDNLRTLVEVHGLTISDVRQLKIYVVGPYQHLLDAWGAVSSWFAGMDPPATLVGVNLLGHSDQLVEIDATITH